MWWDHQVLDILTDLAQKLVDLASPLLDIGLHARHRIIQPGGHDRSDHLVRFPDHVPAEEVSQPGENRLQANFDQLQHPIKRLEHAAKVVERDMEHLIGQIEYKRQGIASFLNEEAYSVLQVDDPLLEQSDSIVEGVLKLLPHIADIRQKRCGRGVACCRT